MQIELTAPVIASLDKYSLTDDLPNLVESQVPPTHAIPTTPPRSFSEHKKTYALANELEGFATVDDRELQ